METWFDLAGRASLAVSGVDDTELQRITEEMDPFGPGKRVDSAPSVELRPADGPAELTELQRPAGDALVTGSDGRTLHVVIAGRSCSIPDPPEDAPAVFRFDPGFPVAELMRSFVKPALQLALLGGGSVAVHATAIERNGRAALVAGWSESGKTEAALALLEEGGSFLSDKWTVIGEDGAASAFPMRVGVRRWLLPHVPRLRKGLPARHRLQLGVAGLAGAATGRGRRRSRSLPTRAIERAVALGERAGLRPSELRRAYGQRDDPTRHVPVSTLVVLTTVAGTEVTAAEATAAWAAERLALSAAYERRGWYGLGERARYLGGARGPQGPEKAIESERELIARALAGARVVEIRAPYPVEPRRITDALAPHL